jgi:hypothetical protein
MSNLEKNISDWRKQLAAGGIKSPAVLDELESHLREDVEKLRRSGMELPDAFNAAEKKIGAAELLRREFEKTSSKRWRVDHERMYSMLLAVFVTFNLATIGGGFVILRLAGGRWEGPVGHLPESAIPWVSTIFNGYTIAMLVTLFARRYQPALGVKLTRYLSWALLPALLFGPLLGLYGLLFVDRNRSKTSVARAQ